MRALHIRAKLAYTGASDWHALYGAKLAPCNIDKEDYKEDIAKSSAARGESRRVK